jgi:hypothetical protein
MRRAANHGIDARCGPAKPAITAAVASAPSANQEGIERKEDVIPMCFSVFVCVHLWLTVLSSLLKVSGRAPDQSSRGNALA